MTIGLKAWNDGDTVPASWTDYTVVECFPREIERQYDETTAVDGTIETWSRTYLRVTISFGSPQLLDSTARSAILTAIGKKNFRVKDARHASLGDANTIRFVKQGDAEIGRGAATLAAQNLTLELISAAVQ